MRSCTTGTRGAPRWPNVPAWRRSRRSRSRQTIRRGTGPWGHYQRVVLEDSGRALETYAAGQRRTGNDPELLASMAGAERDLGRWEAALEHLRRADSLDPRSATIKTKLGGALFASRRYAEARRAIDRGLALAPAKLGLHQMKAMTLLAEGDLAAARAVLAAAAKRVPPVALVAYVATFGDLVWVLDAEQRRLLLRLTPSAFDGDEGNWHLCLAQAYALEGDVAGKGREAQAAAKVLEQQLRATPQDAQSHAALGLALAYLGRKREAAREAERGLALARTPLAKAYLQHQRVRIHILSGEAEPALDRLEPLLTTRYMLTPAWLRIDPNFDALRGSPRFQSLVGSPGGAATGSPPGMGGSRGPPAQSQARSPAPRRRPTKPGPSRGR